MYSLFKKVVTYICLLGTSETVYPAHLFREYNMSYMEKHLQEMYEASRDPFVFANNINNNDNDFDLLDEYDADGFVYYDGLEYIGKDASDYDEDVDDIYEPLSDDYDDDDDDTVNYLPDCFKCIRSYIHRAMNYKDYLCRHKLHEITTGYETPITEDPFEFTESVQDITSQQESVLLDQAIKRHLSKYPYETGFVHSLSHDQELIKEYLNL